MTKGYDVIVAVLITFILSIILINIATYPEIYSTTWRYQLHNDLKAGDVQAQEYYQNTYLSKGKVLFEDVKMEEIHIINKQ